MEYKKIDKDNYTIHILNTDKFKSIFVSLSLINEFNKDSLLKNSVLRRLLVTSTKNLKNEVEVTKKVCELYNSGVSITNDMSSNVITTNIDMEVLEDKYTKKGLLYDALDYYFDCIFNPNIVDGKFEKSNYDLVIKSIEDYFDNQKENKEKYAFDRAYELMDEEYLKYPLNGYKEDLKNITRENMVTYYNELIKNANANLFIIGNINEEDLLKYLDVKLNNKLHKNDNKYIETNYKENTPLKIGESIENNNQSILILIYKIMNLTKRERNVILPVFNRIFGLGTNSKLFKVVREENSLCYNVRSSYSRCDSLLTVQSGISSKNKDKVINFINQELDNMKKGNITEDEFLDAINFRKRNLKQFDDYIDSLIYIKESNVLFENDDLQERKNNLESIKLQEIIDVSKKIELNVEYILKGDKDNE